MTKNYKIGDLIYCIYPNQEGYGIIIDMMNKETGEKYYNKDIIIGFGNKNPKINIEIEILTKKCEDIWNISAPIEILKSPIRKIVSVGDILKMEIEKFEYQYSKIIENMDNKLNFLKRYALTRNDKINSIIHD